MPIAFSRGRPRPGQWVVLDGKVVGIAVESDRISAKTGKSLYGVLSGVITRFPYPHDPEVLAALPDPATWRVDIVDATGFNTVGSVMVDAGRLEPVVSLEQIPEPRRKTCREGWEPRP